MPFRRRFSGLNQLRGGGPVRSRGAIESPPSGAKLIHLTIRIAQHFSGTGDLIRIYSDPARYESRLGDSLRAGGNRM